MSEEKFYRSGFSLIEVVLVIIILGIILTLTISLSMNSLARSNVKTAQAYLVQTLRRAQTIALNNIDGTRAGIYICTDSSATGCTGAPPSIIMFKRSAFATYNPATDDLYEVAANVSFSGVLLNQLTASQEGIIFTQLTGEPNYNGTITISVDTERSDVTLNSKGTVEH